MGIGEEKAKAAAAAANALGLAGAVKLVVCTFLEKKHYRQLFRVLAEQWSNCHSLTAAVRLMEAHGVNLTPEEEQRLQELPEERMIDSLVARMPQQTREQFEQFFLQLSLIASTTTRLRNSIEIGDVDGVDEVLESAEKVGIIAFLIKMAVTQAGLEVKTKEAAHENWLAETEVRMAPLLQSQAQSMVSQKALAQARAQLVRYRCESADKSKKVLLGFVANSEDTMMTCCFVEWAAIMRKSKKDLEIMKEYEAELTAAQKELMDFKAKQTENLRSLLVRAAEGSKTVLVMSCFNALKNEVANAAAEREATAQAAELQEKLKGYSEASAENARKVLARMNASNDDSLKGLAFSAWFQWLEDYKKDKVMNDAVKQAEQRFADFQAKAKANSASVLSRMMSSTGQGLLKSVISEWAAHVKDEKEQAAMQEAINEKAGNLGQFGARNKGTAFSEMQRMRVVTELHCLLAVFMHWKRYMKLERMRRFGQEKNLKKKQQLLGVKGLFKNFALELENGLKEGTPRVDMTRHRQQAHAAAR